MSRVHTVTPSPIGPLTLVADEGVLSGLYLAGQRYRPEPADFGPSDDLPFAAAVTQLREYFAGERLVFDLPLRFNGTEFQRRVWRVLTDIPYGRTRSYAEIASALGKPNAARAVGLANGRNPIAVVVPCHRVVGSSGKLTGYAGGLARKRFLLDLEGGPSLFGS